MPKYNVLNEAECRSHVLWSNHAIMRAVEREIDIRTLYHAWQVATPYELPPGEIDYKVQKYGIRAMHDKFFFDELTGILFTIHVSKSGQWFIETVSIK